MRSSPAGLDQDGDSTYESVGVRKISNGYVTTKTTDDGGGYRSEETFSSDRPKPTVSGGNNSQVTSTLAHAAGYLRESGSSKRTRK